MARKKKWEATIGQNKKSDISRPVPVSICYVAIAVLRMSHRKIITPVLYV